MKKIFIVFMIAFSAVTYSQEGSSSMLQKVVGKWKGLDSINLSIPINLKFQMSVIREILGPLKEQLYIQIKNHLWLITEAKI